MSNTVATSTPRPLLAVSDEDLEDLRARLRATRWAAPLPLPPWEGGTDGEELRRLVGVWASDFDWRAQEAAIGALPWATATVDGVAVRHLRFEGEHEDALPVVLTNGWPSSAVELVELARRLATPSRYGRPPADAFTVVVPVLPGFPLSAAGPAEGSDLPTHELWHRLMHDALGFERYAAHGGDLGAGITGWLAQAHPEAVVGIHLLDVDRRRRPDDADLSAEEQRFLDEVAAWTDAEGAYAHQQRTRPLTLAQGLGDSPSGLLAWLLEKYRAWSDCDGDVSRRFSDDFLLTQASLYWLTGTIATSFWPYYARGHGLAPVLERVEVPTAVAVFPADLAAPPPRRWVERRYHLTRFTSMPRGGHFAAHEEPALLADDIAAAFRGLRSGGAA